MENDYLWDKSGEDKEIERLENALKSFRYQPAAAPLLPIKTLQVEEKPKFSFFTNYFRFAAAGFAALTILFVGLGIWSQFSTKKIEEVADLSQPIVNPIQISNDLISQPIKGDVPSTPKVIPAAERKTNKQIYTAVSKPIKTVFRRAETAPKVKEDKAIQLTAEEKFAYNQLMLALSITGEKLKEVQNKANGVVETNPIKSLR